jgi:hypothetical protein
MGEGLSEKAARRRFLGEGSDEGPVGGGSDEGPAIRRLPEEVKVPSLVLAN